MPQYTQIPSKLQSHRDLIHIHIPSLRPSFPSIPFSLGFLLSLLLSTPPQLTKQKPPSQQKQPVLPNSSPHLPPYSQRPVTAQNSHYYSHYLRLRSALVLLFISPLSSIPYSLSFPSMSILILGFMIGGGGKDDRDLPTLVPECSTLSTELKYPLISGPVAAALVLPTVLAPEDVLPFAPAEARALVGIGSCFAST
jgi:hypothetical protein